MGIRDYFSRHVFKHIDVYKIDDFALEPPKVHRLNHEVITHSIIPEVKVKVHSVQLYLRMKCKAVSHVLTERRVNAKSYLGVNAKSYLVKRYVKQEIKAYSHELKPKVKVHDAMRYIRDMPLEISDMLKYQSKKPKLLPGEMLLAWYSPIVEGAVIKLVWNKQRGTLLVWYNPQSRHYKAKGVYLIRKLGFGAKPEWRWE
ncbi:MAG: hypothetical protein IJP97_02950 [Synergistaceae bacterium]|nr:hypothetical protein [Synergistaceae bacterium]MBR0069434.1 hypothetical protein [Synergistaceae bacterium]